MTDGMSCQGSADLPRASMSASRFSIIREMDSMQSNIAEYGACVNLGASSRKKSHKGGSFLCADQYWARYIAGGRGKVEPDTGRNHVG